MVFTNVYNSRSAESRKDECRDTAVELGATLGANCTIVCISRIVNHAFVGAGAMVNRDVKPLRATILLGKWPNFVNEVEALGRICAAYSRKFQAAGISSTPQLAAGNTSVYAQYTVQVEQRAEVQARLKEQGVPTAVHYPTLLCQQPALRCEHNLCSRRCHSRLAQAASERVMSLPMHPWLSVADQDRLVDALVTAVQQTSIASAA